MTSDGRQMEETPYDVAVVGGGPVGLYAALRAALLNLRVHVLDKGRKWSRGFRVPSYHNFPTYLEGISGKEVISRLRSQLALHRDLATIDDFVIVERIRKNGKGFRLEGTHHPTGSKRQYASKAVVLATGVVDKQPMIGGKLETIFPYANKGLICYCEICDGHLARGKDVAVFGSSRKAALTALDILYFDARNVSVLTNGKEIFEGEKLSPKDRRGLLSKLSSKNIGVFTEEIASLFGVEENFLGVKLLGGRELRFDISFSALGMYKINNDLAVMLGGATDEEGYVLVDDDCRVLDAKGKPITGLYAIGDVNQNWNQVMAGFGDADRAVIHAWSAYL